MAVLGPRLAAQQDCRNLEQSPIQRLLNPAMREQREEARRVLVPTPFALLVSVEHLLGRGEREIVNVVGSADRFQKELKIVALSEAS